MTENKQNTSSAPRSRRAKIAKKLKSTAKNSPQSIKKGAKTLAQKAKKLNQYEGKYAISIPKILLFWAIIITLTAFKLTNFIPVTLQYGASSNCGDTDQRVSVRAYIDRNTIGDCGYFELRTPTYVTESFAVFLASTILLFGGDQLIKICLRRAKSPKTPKSSKKPNSRKCPRIFKQFKRTKK